MADGGTSAETSNDSDNDNVKRKNDKQNTPGTKREERRGSTVVGLENDVEQMSDDSLGDVTNIGLGGQMAVEINPYNKSKIVEAFEKIDTEKNEDIELEEFVIGLRDILKVDLNELELRELFGFMDSDDSNFIGLTEWTFFLTQLFESTLLEHYRVAILSKVQF